MTGNSRQGERIHIWVESSEAKPIVTGKKVTRAPFQMYPDVLKPQMTSLAVDLGRCQEEGKEEEEGKKEVTPSKLGSNKAGMFGTRDN